MSWSRNGADSIVTGAARYAADHPADRHAVLVTSAVPRGVVERVHVPPLPPDTVVYTHENAPRLHVVDDDETIAAGQVSVYVQRLLPLQDPEVHYEGQPVAVVLAPSAEDAQEVADRLEIHVRTQAATVAPDPGSGRDARNWLVPATTSVGDVAAGTAEADVVVDREYRTSARHHNPIEPPATVAEWDGSTVTLHDATQSLFAVRATVATALGLPEDAVRVRAEHVGGGFGSKGYVWPHVLVAAMAAHALGGRVKLVLSRSQTYTSHGYQPPTWQDVHLAARADGTLTAIRHVSTNLTGRYAEYPEFATTGTRNLYACPAVSTHTRVVPGDVSLPTPMRSPAEGPGLFALESAMDELAHELGMDPLELRLRNHADADPTSGLPFSSKELRACYREAARRFGWSARPLAPRSLRSGNELVGWGMASVILHTVRLPATARITMDADGTITLAAGSQEIGGGTRTIMPRLAAEVLGVPPERVRFRMGDTDLPWNLYSVGSSTANSLGSAVVAAAEELTGRLAGEAPPVTVEHTWFPLPVERALHSFGAVFAEVGVDADTFVPRVRRLVAGYSAGRILNPVTARSQLEGGLVWGVGQALLEGSRLDDRLGRWVSKDLCGYRVPVNADVPDLDVFFVDEHDPYAGPTGGRGIGELAPIGVGAAIANAVHHATGVRLRTLPIDVGELVRAAAGLSAVGG